MTRLLLLVSLGLVLLPGVAAGQRASSSDSGAGQVEGYVIDGEVNDTWLEDAEVRFTPRSGAAATVQTGENGYYSVALRPGTYTMRVSKKGFVVTEETVSVRAGASLVENISLLHAAGSRPPEWRFTLTWARDGDGKVEDVDAMLQIPGVEDTLDFRQKGVDYHGTFLDVDARNWSGPETITIKRFESDDWYYYYVFNYSTRNNRAALSKAGIKIEVHKDGKYLKSFRLPPGKGWLFAAFAVKGDVLQPIGEYKYQKGKHPLRGHPN